MSNERFCIFGKEAHCPRGQYLPDKKTNTACPGCKFWYTRKMLVHIVRHGRI